MALDNFIINSDYPMDMVVFAAEGTVAANSATSISHGLSFVPLCFGVWSSDGGSTWKPITEMNITGNETLVYLSSTTREVTVTTQLASSSIQFRVWGLQPADNTARTTPPQFQVSDFMLNSDFNYSKLVGSAVWTVTATSGTTLITHNLGYIPEVIAWRESAGGVIRPFINSYGSSSAGEAALIATNTEVKAYCPGGAGGSDFSLAKIHVRVYGGKNG